MSNALPCYIWKDGKVVTRLGAMYPGTARYFGFIGCPVVDTNYVQPEDRVGMYQQRGRIPIWAELHVSELPDEFRTHLLLLGVT